MALRLTGQRRTAETLVAGAVAVNGLTLQAGQLLLPDGTAGVPALAFASDTDTGMALVSAQIGLYHGGARKFSVATQGPASSDARLFMGAQSIQFTERTDPAAPAADNVHLYAKDSGAAKTQLAARFATGAVQVPAVEP